MREKIELKFPITSLQNRFLKLGDEVFIQLNQPTWVTNRILSQNRASIGIEFPISKTTSYEIGYLNQFQFQSQNQMSNVLYFIVKVSA